MSDTVKTLVLEQGRVYYYGQYLFENGEPKSVPASVADELLEEEITFLNGNQVVSVKRFREVPAEVDKPEPKTRKAKDEPVTAS